MEKKVLTKILRIKELIGGESLLTEQVSFVKALKSLQKIFSYESDDVIKKIINFS